MTSTDVQALLTSCRTIAVVGLSYKPDRPSYGVAQYMQRHGFIIVPVNPNCAEILGEKCYASLLDIEHAVDIVNVFRRTEDVLPIGQQAIRIGAKCLWQQIGVVNHEAHALAQANGLASVMDRCLKIEHQRLLQA